MLREEYINPFLLSFKLALTANFIILLISIPLACFIYFYKNKFTNVIDIFINIPLILPPSVLGFYLLILLNRESFMGKLWFTMTEKTLVFHFSGLVIGSIIYSFPFVIRPILTTLNLFPKQFIAVSASLGNSPLRTFFYVVLPFLKPAIISGFLLGFLHTIGEFGIVLMLGGSIPGETKTIAIAIFDAVEQLDYESANKMSLILFFCISLILILLGFNKKLKNI